jgi:flagellar hook-associated protein 3 FlgL
MTRISTRAANTTLLHQNLQTQKRLFDAQVSITSEKKSNAYKGISSDSRRLVNIENSTSLMKRFNLNNDLMDVKLNALNTSVEAVSKTFKEFKVFLDDFALTSKKKRIDVKDVQDRALQALKSIEGYLNISVDGQYLLSGKKVLTEPVNFGLTTLESFQEKFDGNMVSIATTRDAMLEDFSYSQDILNKNVFNTDASNFLQFNESSSTITTSSPLLSNLTVGSNITIANSVNNNGTYQISAVSSDGRTATVKTHMLTDSDITETATLTTPTPASIGVKQIDNVTLSGVYEVGDTVSVNIDSVAALTYSVVAADLTVDGAGGGGVATNGQSLGHIAVKVAAVVNAHEATTAKLTSATAAGAVIALTGASTNVAITTVTTATEATPTITYADPNDADKTLSLTSADFTQLSFNNSTSIVSASVVDGLQAIPVGTAFTVSGSANNDGSYTVKSNDGTNLVVNSLKLADEGLTGNTFFDLYTDTDTEFTAASKTIEIRQSGTTTPVPNSFNGLRVGQSITVSASVSNNANYTVATISADGSSITVAETIVNETDANGTTIGSTSNSNFSLKSDTQLVFNAANKTIQLNDNTSTAIANAFSSLSVGMKITAASMPTSGNNTTYTISSISADGSQITVAETIAGSETDTNGARLSVYGAKGSISATSYYKGDDQVTTHRVSTTQDFTRDIDGMDPAFEKGIRGLQIIAQGVYGTAGGLDQNHERVDDALYLIKSTLQRAVSGNSPYGVELTGNMEEVESDIGYNRVLMQTTNQINLQMIAFFDSTVADIENTDLQSIVTKLLDDQVALEASYAAYARISKLSLVTYMK